MPNPAPISIHSSSSSSSSSSDSDSDAAIPVLQAKETAPIQQTQTEQLRAGDTILYCSPMFVAGDPRGKKTAIVTKIHAQSENVPDETQYTYQYPIEVNTSEQLPRTCLCRRKKDREGKPVELPFGKWRKLFTFEFVTSELKNVPTANDQFVQRIQQATTSAFAEIRPQRTTSATGELSDFEDSQDMKDEFNRRKTQHLKESGRKLKRKQKRMQKKHDTSQAKITHFIQKPPLESEFQIESDESENEDVSILERMNKGKAPAKPPKSNLTTPKQTNIRDIFTTSKKDTKKVSHVTSSESEVEFSTPIATNRKKVTRIFESEDEEAENGNDILEEFEQAGSKKRKQPNNKSKTTKSGISANPKSLGTKKPKRREKDRRAKPLETQSSSVSHWITSNRKRTQENKERSPMKDTPEKAKVYDNFVIPKKKRSTPSSLPPHREKSQSLKQVPQSKSSLTISTNFRNRFKVDTHQTNTTHKLSYDRNVDSKYHAPARSSYFKPAAENYFRRDSSPSREYKNRQDHGRSGYSHHRPSPAQENHGERSRYGHPHGFTNRREEYSHRQSRPGGGFIPPREIKDRESSYDGNRPRLHGSARNWS